MYQFFHPYTLQGRNAICIKFTTDWYKKYKTERILKHVPRKPSAIQVFRLWLWPRFEQLWDIPVTERERVGSPRSSCVLLLLQHRNASVALGATGSVSVKMSDWRYEQTASRCIYFITFSWATSGSRNLNTMWLRGRRWKGLLDGPQESNGYW